jgi:hypothetical protein
VTEKKPGPARKYEERDANFPRVMTTAFALLGVMVVGLLVAWGAYVIFTSQADAPASRTETFTTPDPATLPPGPNLEADPHESLVALRVREDSLLNSYGWEDSARGIARVPIGRAKELYLEEGKNR